MRAVRPCSEASAAVLLVLQRLQAAAHPECTLLWLRALVGASNVLSSTQAHTAELRASGAVMAHGGGERSGWLLAPALCVLRRIMLAAAHMAQRSVVHHACCCVGPRL
jgi:hypothetical protein